MKKIIKYISILAMVISFSSCGSDEKSFPQPDLVPVYAISNIIGDNPLESISIYREKALLVEFQNSINVESFKTNNYSDSSDETNYLVTFNKVIVHEPELGPVTTEEVPYELTGDVATGIGSLKITTDNGDGSFTERIYVIDISVENRLN